MIKKFLRRLFCGKQEVPAVVDSPQLIKRREEVIELEQRMIKAGAKMLKALVDDDVDIKVIYPALKGQDEANIQINGIRYDLEKIDENYNNDIGLPIYKIVKITKDFHKMGGAIERVVLFDKVAR